MLDSDADFGLLSVALFLFICQGMIAARSFVDSRFDCRRKLFCNRRAIVGTVGIDDFVVLIDKFWSDLTVVNICARCFGFHDQFAVGIDFDVIFVAVIGVFAFLGPACVCVFLGFLVLVLFTFPFFRNFAFFDPGVLFGSIALAGDFNKCCINDTAAFGNISGFFQLFQEAFEERVTSLSCH